MKTICAHTLVKNEDKYLWYAVMSVIDQVDSVMLWDTGSSDNTWKIIEEMIKLYPKKIKFKEVGEVTPEEFPKMRQKMLEETKADWVILVDGDEVWWQDSVAKVAEFIREHGDAYETIVSPSYNVVGDIFHYQEELAGQYKIDGRQGHLNIRAMSMKIPRLHVEKPHGSQGYYDEKRVVIQDRQKDKRMFLNVPYMHFTNVSRSTDRSNDLLVPKREGKLKYELGESFPKDFYYPEVFFRPRPLVVESPWKVSDSKFNSRAFVETPMRKIKRRVWKSRTGY